MTAFIPFSGFAPSVDPTTPGAILDCANMVPTLRGMKAAPSPVPYGNPAFPSQVFGGATCELLTGAYRTFVGTSTDLYEVVGNTNNNVSNIPGGYVGGENRWRFAQFGNASLATNGQDPIQQSISAGSFAPIGDVASITVDTPGANFISVPTVTISGAGGTGATAVAVLTPTGATPIGGVASAPITAGGTTYTTAPTVVFGPPPAGGTQALGHATIASGAVTGIVIDNPGAGYLVDPPVTISGGGGSGATATSKLATGTVTAINVTNEGSAFTGVATVAITGGGGTGATATAVMNLAPSAAIITITQGFVFALNVNSAANGAQPDGWWCSGLYDQTQWTPDQSTQCANGVIVDTPGALTAGTPFGTNLIVFKGTSMFYGVYEGPPVIWAMNLISPTIGTPCQEAVINIGQSLLFMGSDSQVYEFDGSMPYPIGNSVREWILANWSPTQRTQICSYHDQPNSTVYWYFCSSTNTTGIPDTSLVYHYITGKFGRADLVVEAALQAITGQITWQDMGALPNVTTWNTLPQIPYNDPYWTESSQIVGVVDSTQTLKTLSGIAGASSLTTSFFGDDLDYMSCQGIVPRFTQQPLSCTGAAFTMANLGAAGGGGLGDATTEWSLGAWYDGVLAGDFSARWAQIQLNFTGNHEIVGMFPQTSPAGEI